MQEDVKQVMVSLRKKNQSVEDIKSHLDGKGIKSSIRTIHRILQKEGFERLPKTDRE